jgi:hypothetical protein
MKLPSEVYNYNYYYDWDNPSEMTEAIIAAERALIERAEKAEAELAAFKWIPVSERLPETE